MTADDDQSSKPGFFSKEGSPDLGFLDENQNDGDDPDGKEKTPNAATTQAAIAELDADLEDDDEDSASKQKPGRKKIDKSGLVETFSKLFEEGILVPFEGILSKGLERVDLCQPGRKREISERTDSKRVL